MQWTLMIALYTNGVRSLQNIFLHDTIQQRFAIFFTHRIVFQANGQFTP